MKRNKKKCTKCEREIALSSYNKHLNSCTGKKLEFEKVENGFKCPYCDEIRNKLGIKSHIWRRHTEEGVEFTKKQNPNIGYIEGTRTVWNKNLTKDIDIRLKAQAERTKTKYKKGILVSPNKGKKLEEIVGYDRAKEIKEKESFARSFRIKTLGVGGFKNTKVYKTENIKKEVFCLRGTWELKLANWLNENKVLWRGGNEIVYVNNGIKRRYLPDFYLPEQQYFLEVKGYYNEENRKKIQESVRQNNIKLFMLFKKQIDLLPNVKTLEDLIVHCSCI